MSDPLRDQLVELIEGRGAHMPFEEAVAEFPDEAINRRAPNVAYTPWHLVEHIRLTLDDIVRYIREPGYESPDWPEGYWPAPDATATPDGFRTTCEGVRAGIGALRAMAEDPSVDLLAPLPHTPGHTIYREIVIAADHNAYHVGEFAILRQVMGTWPPGHE